jgi:hypothetical protein
VWIKICRQLLTWIIEKVKMKTKSHFSFFRFFSPTTCINFCDESAVQSLTPLLVQFRLRKSTVALRAQVVDSCPRRQLLILSSSIVQLMTVAPSNAVPTKFRFLNEPLQYPFNSSSSSSSGEEVTPNITQHVSDNNLSNITLSSMQTTRGSNLSSAADSLRNNNNFLYDSNASTIVTIQIPRTDSNDAAIVCEGENVINCTIIQQIFTF